MTMTATPSKPWAASTKDRAIDGAIFVGSLLSSYLLVFLTALKGKLAYFVCFFITYAIFTTVFKGIQRGNAAAKDALVNSLVAIGAIVTP